MSRKILTFLIVILIFTFSFLHLTVAAVPQELRDSISQKSRELQEITDKLKENEKYLEEIQGQGKTLKQEVDKIDRSIKQADLGIRSSEVVVGKLGLEIDSLKYDITDAGQSIVSKKRPLPKFFRNFSKR